MESNRDFVDPERQLPEPRLTFPPGPRRGGFWGSLLLCVVLGGFAGCEDAPLTTSGPDGGGQVGGSGGSSAGHSGTDAGAGGTTPDGMKVWTANATKLVAKILGDGFAPAPNPAAPCMRGMTYTLTTSDRKLSWRFCNDLVADPAMALKTGERVLSTAELANVVAALDTVVVSHGTGCGADKSTELLTITTPAGDRDFFDDFYACNATPGRTYVANTDSVFAALYALAK